MNEAERESSIRLRDGRRLGFVESGVPGGWPVLFFHGTPGSRLDGWPDEDLRRLEARQISTDRPGYGISDNLPARRLVDWANDVEQLADHLGLERFAVTGGSGGGPHALVCAALLPDRVTAVSLISPGGPYFEHPELAEHPDFELLVRRARQDAAAAWEERLSACVAAAQAMLADPEGDAERQLAAMSDADRAVASRFMRDHATKVRDMLQQGGAGWARDFFVSVGMPWDFDMDAVVAPLHVWSGDSDAATSKAARWLAEQVPQGTLHLLAGAGHALNLTAEEVLGPLAPRSSTT